MPDEQPLTANMITYGVEQGKIHPFDRFVQVPDPDPAMRRVVEKIKSDLRGQKIELSRTNAGVVAGMLSRLNNLTFNALEREAAQELRDALEEHGPG